LHIQEALGEIITYLETTKACIIASEAQAITTPDGVMHPEAMSLHPIRLQFPRWYPRVVDLLRDLIGLDLMCVPPARVYDSPVGAQLEQVYGAPLTQRANTSHVLHLARDLLMSAFGSREVLYERYFFGDALRNRAALYTSFDASHCTALVQRLLANQAE
jgi:4-hydroxyphenylacetate 3-monooxygenase